MLPLVSARTEDFRLSLKKASLAPTYDLHVEYDGGLLGGVIKRSALCSDSACYAGQPIPNSAAWPG